MRRVRELRIDLLLLGLVLAFGALVARLYFLQVLEASTLQVAATKQQRHIISLEEDLRGQIRDRRGQDLLGRSLVTKALILPKQLAAPELLASKLSLYLGFKTLAARALLQGEPHLLPFVVDKELRSMLTEFQGKGLEFVTIEERYGSKPVATNVIGHLGFIDSPAELEDFAQQQQKEYSANDKVGKRGIELLYEQGLRGTRPRRSIQLVLDAQGRVIKGLSKQELHLESDPLRQHVNTTLDRDLQLFCESRLEEKGYTGAIVVLDAKTSDILACASSPFYRPDQLQTALVKGNTVFLDRTRSLYPPGSVFKVLTTAAAWEQGLVSDTTSFPCPGKSVIKCDTTEPHTSHTLREAFAHSHNSFFINLGYLLGQATITEYVELLGLNNQEVLGYPVAADKRQRWDRIGENNNLSNSFIGQGSVLVTPLQVSAMMATIANGGIYNQPRLVSNLENDNGQVIKTIANSQPKRVLSEATSQNLQHLLRTAVKDGTGKQAWLEDVGSAGKTGSAQMGNQETLCWFTGFFPADNPQYVITVAIENGKSGGATAAPLFKAIAEHMLDM